MPTENDDTEPVDSDKVQIARYVRDMVNDLCLLATLSVIMFTAYSMFKLVVMLAAAS